MFFKFKENLYYLWIYAVGTVLTFVNYMFIRSQYLSDFCLFILFCILFYKSTHILMCYKKSEHKYKKLDKRVFVAKYRQFRCRVASFWLAFVVLCILGKIFIQIEYYYFYSCTYFFLLIDRLFVNFGCLLQKFSNTKNKIVVCCCGCPCRGWDLMMIHTPLLFALNRQHVIECVLICASSALAVISMVYWESGKYHLVEEKPKCPKVCNLSKCREYTN